MAGEWCVTTIGEVVTLQRGFDLPTTERKPGNHLVIASTGPVGTHNEAAVRGPGVVIGRSGSLGGGQFIRQDFWPLNTTLWVKDFKGNDPRFCYFLLKSFDLAQFNVGSGVPTLNRNHVHPLPVSLPPLPEQRAIAHILGTLDDKIELNRRMNQTLEEMARALFKSWFVDFDPVRAKMEGRDPGLPQHLADLFPDRLVDSELGEIPEGWIQKSIYNFADVVYGAPFASKQFKNEKQGVPLIRIRDLATHEPGISTQQVHKKGHFINPGDIVVGMDGEFRLHVWKGPKAWLNQRVCHFEPRSGVPTAFLAEALSEPLAFFERGKVGTTVIHLGKSDIDTFRLLHPGQGLLNAFAGIAEPLLDRTVTNALESRALAHARDLLLDLPAFFGPPITGEQRQSAWLSRSRVLLDQREPASPASAHRHPSQHGAAL